MLDHQQHRQFQPLPHRTQGNDIQRMKLTKPWQRRSPSSEENLIEVDLPEEEGLQQMAEDEVAQSQDQDLHPDRARVPEPHVVIGNQERDMEDPRRQHSPHPGNINLLLEERRGCPNIRQRSRVTCGQSMVSAPMETLASLYIRTDLDLQGPIT